MIRYCLPVSLLACIILPSTAFFVPAQPGRSYVNTASSTGVVTSLSLESSRYDNDRRSFATQSANIIGSLVVGGVFPALAVDEDKVTAQLIDPNTDLPKITQRVFLDVKVGNSKPGRITIGLFGQLMPKATENFLSLCSNEENGVSYVGTSFYRVISDISVQGGAVGSSNGKTGKSAFSNGDPFLPDNYTIRHTRAGLVSAVRGVGGMIDSRFFFQMQDDAGWADDRYAAFGIVEREKGATDIGSINGWDLVKKISRVDVSPPLNSPKEPVIIVGCGIL